MSSVGLNVPGTLYLGNHPGTTAVAIGASGLLTVSSTTATPSVTIAGPLTCTSLTPSGPIQVPDQSGTAPGLTFSSDTSTGFNRVATGAVGYFSAGKESFRLGASAVQSFVPALLGTNSLSSGAITAGGTVSCGTNAMTCGALSSGSISCGTNSVTCGSLQVPGGALSAPSVCFDAQSGFYESGGAIGVSVQGSNVGTWTYGGLSMSSGQLDVGPIVSHGAGLTLSGTGSIYAGTNPLTCGSITGSGTVSCGTNSMTCGALSCSGAVTASGTVSCGTNSMTCGALICASVASSGDVTLPRYSIRLYKNSAQSISTATTTSVVWDTIETTGGGASHWTFSPPGSLLTCPAAGRYLITYRVVFIGSGGIIRDCWSEVNPPGGAPGGRRHAEVALPANSAGNWAGGGSFTVQLALNDTLLVAAFQDSGGTLSLAGLASTTNQATELSITRLSE